MFLLLVICVRSLSGARLYTDTTYADLVQESPKCRKCAPLRPCYYSALPNLISDDPYSVESALFLTDVERERTPEPNWCNCPLYSSVYYSENNDLSCTKLIDHCQNQDCEDNCVSCFGFYNCGKDPRFAVIPFLNSPLLLRKMNNDLLPAIYVFSGSPLNMGYSFEDSRRFVLKNGERRDHQNDCLRDLHKKIHFTNAALCYKIPSGLVYRYQVFHDAMLRVDLDPSAPHNEFVEGYPVPVGRRGKLRINANFSNTPWITGVTYVFRYPLYFEFCTYMFTFRGCGDDSTGNNRVPITLEVYREPYDKDVGCSTMEKSDHRWRIEPQPDLSNPTSFNEEPLPLPLFTSTGSVDGHVYTIRPGELNPGKYIVTYDFVQKGHPTKYTSFDQGHVYHQRSLCTIEILGEQEFWVYPEVYSFDADCKKTVVIKMRNDNSEVYSNDLITVTWKCLEPTETCPNEVQTKGIEPLRIELKCNVNYTFQCQIHHPKSSATHLVYANLRTDATTVILTPKPVKTNNFYNTDVPLYFQATDVEGLSQGWQWSLKEVRNRKSTETVEDISEETVRQKSTEPNIFLIEPNSLDEKKQYVIIARTTYGSSSLRFLTNDRPMGGRCVVSPKSGISGVTEFNISCSGWVDVNTPLKYKLVEYKESGEAQSAFDFRYNSLPSWKTVLYSHSVSVLIFDAEEFHREYLIDVSLRTSGEKISKKSVKKMLADTATTMDDSKHMATKAFHDLANDIESEKFEMSNVLKREFLNEQSKAVGPSSGTTDVLRSLDVLEITMKVYKTEEKIDDVLLTAAEHMTNLLEIVADQKENNVISDFDFSLAVDRVTSIASAILLQNDSVVIENKINEYDHEQHRLQARDATLMAMEAMEWVGSALKDSQRYQQNPPLVITKNAVDFTVMSTNVTMVNEYYKTVPGHRLIFPNETVEKLGNSPLYIVTISTSKDVFWWLPNDGGVLGVNVTLTQSSRLKPEGPVAIHLKLKSSSKDKHETVNGTLMWTAKCLKAEKLDRSVSIHKIRVPDGEGVIIFEIPEEVATNVKMLAKFDSRPRYGELLNATVPENNRFEVVFSNFNDTKDLDIYLAVIPSKLVKTPFRYSFTYKTVLCTVWIGSTFETKGCSYSPLSYDTEDPSVWCLCRHQSWFSVSLLLPPNSVVLSEDIHLFSTIFTNFYVAALVLSLLATLVIMLLWGNYRDRQDVDERIVISLQDNIPSDGVPYVVAVFTGERFGSGTTSKVALRIFGEKGRSRAHVLAGREKSRRRVLAVGTDNWFLVRTTNHLGPLQKIHMWHNHTGFSPEWYCKSVAVYDLTTNEKYEFLVERWFTFDHRLSISEAQMAEIQLSTEEDLTKSWPLYISGWVYSGMRESHHWASIFTRHPRSLFTRCQRAIIAVGLIMSMMLASMMFFVIEDPPGPADYPESKFDLEALAVGAKSAGVSIVLTLLIVFCFQRSNKYEKHSIALKLAKREQLAKEKKKRRKHDRLNAIKLVLKMLSPEPILYRSVVLSKSQLDAGKERKGQAFLIAGWALSTATVVVSSFFVTLYGLRFGVKKSLVWMMSFISGTIGDIIFVDPLKVLIFACLVAMIFKRSTAEGFTMEVRYEAAKLIGEDYIRSLKRNLSLRVKNDYRPTRTSRIEKRRAKLRSRNSYDLYISGALYTSLCVIVGIFLAALGVKEESYGVRQLRFYLAGSNKAIYSETSMFEYYHETAIPALHNVYWYNKKPLPVEASEVNARTDYYSSEVKGFAIDLTSKLMGVPRLRQIRLKPSGNVKIAGPFRPYFKISYGLDLISREDTATYLPQWKPYDDSVGVLKQLWTYSAPEITNTGFTLGKSLWFYEGGGYVSFLSWNLGTSNRILQNLKMENWADEKTRCVILEFNLFNNNVKQFTSVRFIVEALPCGFYISRLQVETSPLLFATKPQSKIILLLAAILAIVLALYTLFVFVQISRDGFMMCIGSSRGIFDIILICVGFFSVTCFYERAMLFSSFSSYLDRAPHDQYTSLFNPFEMNDQTHVVFGMFTLIVTVSMGAAIYQAMGSVGVRKMLLNVYGLFFAFVFINMLLNTLVNVMFYTVDQNSYDLLLFQLTFKEVYATQKTVLTLRLLLFVCPFLLVLLKLNAASIIFCHGRFAVTKKRKTYFKMYANPSKAEVPPLVGGTSKASTQLPTSAVRLKVDNLSSIINLYQQ